MVESASTEDIHSPMQGNDITYMDMIDENESLGESEIKEFLSGSTIFLTGGTGFIGKLIVEKVLRSCPEVKKIFFLARSKKNKDIEKRLQEQFDDVLYEKLKKEQHNFVDKIHVIEGDISLPYVGISEENRKLLSEEVDIIFHGAATVRFDETLKTAVRINVRGTREMLKIAKTCKKLRAFVHTSTAYSYCPLKVIEEKFYNAPIPTDNLIDLVENVDDNILQDITRGLLGEHPNTYVFTKAVAENAVLTYGRGMPVAMVRPSIIIGTARDPISGWIDNIYGPTGVVVGATLGLLHTLNAKKTSHADLVPGDMVVNALLAAALSVSKSCKENHEKVPDLEADPVVFNYVSGTQNPITWEKFMHYNEIYGFQVPPVKTMWYYLFMLNESKFVHVFFSILLHWIPAYLVDGFLMMIGKKPMLREAYRKIEKFSVIISHFALNEWQFIDINTQNLYNGMSKADKHIYGFNIKSIDWNEYLCTYVKGVRRYLLQDPLETIPEGLSRHRKLKYAHYTIICLFSLLMLKIFWSIISLFISFKLY